MNATLLIAVVLRATISTIAAWVYAGWRLKHLDP